MGRHTAGATCVRSTFHRLPFRYSLPCRITLACSGPLPPVAVTSGLASRRPSRLANGAAGEEKDAEREPELSLDNENVPPSRGGMATPSAQGTPGSSAFSSTAKSWRSPGASTGSPLSPSPRRSPLAPRLLNVPTPMSAPSSNVKRRVSAASLASGLRCVPWSRRPARRAHHPHPGFCSSTFTLAGTAIAQPAGRDCLRRPTPRPALPRRRLRTRRCARAWLPTSCGSARCR
jgi:hypothetical protein